MIFRSLISASSALVATASLLIVSQFTTVSAQTKPVASSSAELPRGADGQPLNLDFEAGSLLHWRASGEAFESQPIRGGTVARRKKGAQSGRRGQYWIGTYEIHQDAPQGTLTSEPFKVTQPFASFLVGGGQAKTTRVEIALREKEKVIYTASGRNLEKMRRVVVDLQPYAGKEIFIRLVDRSSGGWGHINFDDFQLHAKKPVVAVAETVPPLDDLQYAGLKPVEAAEAMTLPEGFTATALVGEPDVRQPIAFTIDDRGRIWVAEAYEYPFRNTKGPGRDRILIFEDTNGDGSLDKRTIFIEKLNLVSGLEVGFGGVWVGQAPYLLFIPDADGDDKPDGPPQILLDGWGYQDTHETLNAFIWGPDGWLYGCHGVFTHSNVGKPGAKDDQRTRINAGIWRYHPTRHEFEVFAHGTSNPWGVDFNDQGQCFLTACVIPHLFHVIQGGRYRRQGGVHFNQYTYDDIKTIARHRHWIGGTPHSGNGRSDAAGGGHAHSGAMIYLGGAWPQQYHNQLFMNNIHGARLNQDKLAPNGSGYVGDRADDFLLTHDRWSQIVNMRYGPDGQMLMIDWYDNQQCHRREVEIHDRSNGRIFRVAYNNAPTVQVDLKKLSNMELVELQLHENDWYVRHARRILQERYISDGPDPAVRQALEKMAFQHADVTRRLRGLWALHVRGRFTDQQRDWGLDNDQALVRAWTIQLMMENQSPPGSLLAKFTEMAHDDPSQVVRLYLASATQRLPMFWRWQILQGLTSHAQDASDHNLPLMYWYAAEPLGKLAPRQALQLARDSKVPLLLSFMARRVGESGSPQALRLLVEALGSEDQPKRQLTLLNAINRALQGRRRVDMPPNWSAVAQELHKTDDQLVRSQTQALAVTFGDPRAMEQLRAVVVDNNAAAPLRKNALTALLAARDDQLAKLMQSLIDDPVMSRPALRGLAAYDDAKTPELILKAYASLDLAARRDALATLTARRQFATALLDAMSQERVPLADVTADLARQIRNLGDAKLTARLSKLWGIVRNSPEDKIKLIAQTKKMLAARPRTPVDAALGRAIFVKTCAQCHKLFAAGGDVGPELTGSNRANIDYLLSNVIDPSAVMAKEYQPEVIITTDGRTITGLIKQQTDAALTIATSTETIVLPKDEVELMKKSEKSMMPDDLLKQLKPLEVRALVAYLSGPAQTPMLATPDTLKNFYNGADLTGWDGDKSLWSVENGEIVGRTTGLKRNEFLIGQMIVGDFRLSMQIKLVDNAGNSGIQFRSQSLPGGSVKGYQADVGKGWWGKLYEEHGRNLLWKKSGEEFVKSGQWNQYIIVATGSRIRTFINGHICVDLDDPTGAKRGVIAFQLHSGGPTEVRFKDLQLELNPQLSAE